MTLAVAVTVMLASTVTAVTTTAVGDAVSVRVEQGMLQGRVEDGITVYKGVPFAAPPVGELRWRPPQPPAVWSGVREANTTAPSCMQTPGFDPTAMAGLRLAEDCLYLNIWAPRSEVGKPLPVMVWIYGGGFIEGSPDLPAYDGLNLAKHGVVVVNVSYRLGPFGFLALPELSAESPHHVSGNYGLLDQIAALQWVKQNIAALGGDPGRVTIFGQSAGGISTSMLAASPLAKGLFHGVISQSGGSFGPVRVPPYPGENMQTLSDAEHTGHAFVQQLPGKTLAELRKLPAQTIQAARFSLGEFWPVQDGWVILDDQYRLYERGSYNDTPVLIGSNSDEGALFAPRGTASQYLKDVQTRFGPYASELLKLYPATESAWRQSSMDLTRDAGFGWANFAWARLQSHSARSKVFLYYFAHVPPRPADSRFKEAIGAVHGEELAYVFSHLTPKLPWGRADRALSEELITYWTQFAKRGDPNSPGLPTWPAFNDQTHATMLFDSTAHAGVLPNKDKLELLDRYYAWRRTPEGAEFVRRPVE